MENERNVSRKELQPVAQVDNHRGEPKACNHLMLYHVRPPSMEALTLATEEERFVQHLMLIGRAAGHGRATGCRRRHSHNEVAASVDRGHAADGGEARVSA
eukprot:749380-Pleurochrysis_carterae.AAC.1